MKAIFRRDFRFTSRRRNAGWHVQTSDSPQSFPSELIEAAVAAGAAEIVAPKSAAAKSRASKPGDQGES